MAGTMQHIAATLLAAAGILELLGAAASLWVAPAAIDSAAALMLTGAGLLGIAMLLQAGGSRPASWLPESGPSRRRSRR